MEDLKKVWDDPEAVCPVGSIGYNYDSFDHKNMDAVLAKARDVEPVFFAKDIGYWVITRYEDVRDILRDPVQYSAANANTPISPVPQEALDILEKGGYALEGIQVNCDPPKHTRIRNVAKQLLNTKQFALMEDDIRRLVIEALDELDGKSQIDMLEDLAYELPAKVIFLLLGIPPEDAARIKQWASNRFLLTFSRATHEQQVEAAKNLLEFWHYCVDLVSQRIDEPQEDYSSGLLKLRDGDDEVLTVNEIVSATFGLLFAGHETTTSYFTSMFRALLGDRDKWAAICADPDLIPTAVEETLRLYGSVSSWRRRTLCNVTIAGVDIPANSNLLLSFTSANRDAAKFENNEEIDLHRQNAKQHMSFGNSIHLCLGASLVRLQSKILLEEFCKRFPDAYLTAPEDDEYVQTFAMRILKSLPVSLSGPPSTTA